MSGASSSPSRPIDGPRQPAQKGPARRLVVLLHGYGSNGDDLIALAPHLRQFLPDAAFAAPNAPTLLPGMPVQGGGRQWFSLDHYDPGLMRRDPRQAARIYEIMLEGAKSAAGALNAFIDAELARHNLTPDKLALVGFSQGTMMALHVGLRRKVSPAAILGYSGALLGAAALQDEKTCAPPLLLIHGSDDDVVPLTALFETANGLGEAGIPAQWHICHGLPHSIDAEGMELGGFFLAQVARWGGK